eukprot:4333359-Heterocapsa_arctica.AAC.1
MVTARALPDSFETPETSKTMLIEKWITLLFPIDLLIPVECVSWSGQVSARPSTPPPSSYPSPPPE